VYAYLLLSHSRLQVHGQLAYRHAFRAATGLEVGVGWLSDGVELEGNVLPLGGSCNAVWQSPLLVLCVCLLV